MKYKARPKLEGSKYRIEVLRNDVLICLGRSKSIFFEYVEFDTELEAVGYINGNSKLDLIIPTLSDRIKSFRSKMGFSNIELAYYLDVSKSTLKNWINGRFAPSADNMDMLEGFLG